MDQKYLEQDQTLKIRLSVDIGSENLDRNAREPLNSQQMTNNNQDLYSSSQNRSQANSKFPAQQFGVRDIHDNYSHNTEYNNHHQANLGTTSFTSSNTTSVYNSVIKIGSAHSCIDNVDAQPHAHMDYRSATTYAQPTESGSHNGWSIEQPTSNNSYYQSCHSMNTVFSGSARPSQVEASPETSNSNVIQINGSQQCTSRECRTASYQQRTFYELQPNQQVPPYTGYVSISSPDSSVAPESANQNYYRSHNHHYHQFHHLSIGRNQSAAMQNSGRYADPVAPPNNQCLDSTYGPGGEQFPFNSRTERGPPVHTTQLSEAPSVMQEVSSPVPSNGCNPMSTNLHEFHPGYHAAVPQVGPLETRNSVDLQQNLSEDSIPGTSMMTDQRGVARRRKNATRETTALLKHWLDQHLQNPYPTKGEKSMLSVISHMTITQVSTWFANARRRMKKEHQVLGLRGESLEARREQGSSGPELNNVHDLTSESSSRSSLMSSSPIPSLSTESSSSSTRSSSSISKDKAE